MQHRTRTALPLGRSTHTGAFSAVLLFMACGSPPDPNIDRLGETPTTTSTDTPEPKPPMEPQPPAIPDGAGGAPGAETLTESITTVKGVCVGEAVACPNGRCSGCDTTPGHEACSGGHHRPCAGWGAEHHCKTELGCRWEIQEFVNEGTATGKRCTQTPKPCGHPGFCPQGCVRHEERRGSLISVTCSGTPTPCSAFHYSQDCSKQLGCVWE